MAGTTDLGSAVEDTKPETYQYDKLGAATDGG